LKNINVKKLPTYRYTILEHVVYNLNYEIFSFLDSSHMIDIKHDAEIRKIDIIKEFKENTETKIFNKKFMEKQGFTSEQMYNIVGIYNKLFP
jgi:hypothetical protein